MSAGRLLLVEDDRGVRESLARALELEGFDVSIAPDGLAGLDMIVSRSPDVVILDVMMPYLDGLEVARRARAGGDTTPILMLTARHEVSRRVEGLDAGADDYLVKPFALDELLARIRALLRRGGVSGQGKRLRLADLSLVPALLPLSTRPLNPRLRTGTGNRGASRGRPRRHRIRPQLPRWRRRSGVHAAGGWIVGRRLPLVC